MLRQGCEACGTKIGAHWVAGGLICCVGAVVIGFSGLLLSTIFSPLVAVMLLFVEFFTFSCIVGKVTPLERKDQWWAP
jgi:uncharacterized protein (DUF983 family)